MIVDTPSAVQPNLPTAGKSGLVPRITNEQLDKMAAANRKANEELQQQEPVIRLSSHIETCWQAAQQAKHPIEERLLNCMRQRDGLYDPKIESKLQEQANKTGQPLIFMMLTNIKCRAAKSWIKDIMLTPGERPFSVEPTPIPDLPQDIKNSAKQHLFQEYVISKALEAGINPAQLTPDIVQQLVNPQELFQHGQGLYDELMKMVKEKAEEDAEDMSDEINDDLKEGQWYEALEDTIDDIVDFPTGFMAGPILRRRKKLDWFDTPAGSVPQPTQKIVREWDSVSPFDLYPSPGAKTLQDGYLIHHIRFLAEDLNDLKDVPGFSKEAIEDVLIMNPGGFRLHLTYETERAKLEDREYDRSDPVARYDTLKFMGSVQGNILLEWGMTTDDIKNPAENYNIIAYKIGGTVISARINPHPLGKRRYYKASFEQKNASIWGKGVPELMSDVQAICNSCARAIVRNMAVASGPQTWVYSDRIPPNVMLTEQHPWKLWQFNSPPVGTSGNQPPMGWFQPDPIVDVLLKLYDYFYKQASEVTGIPAYTYGSEDVSGAGKTASGLSMLMNAASKGLKEVAKHIDGGIIKPSVYEDWLHIMLNEPEKAKGDIEIVARASEYLIQMEQLAIRRMEWLQATNNPTDLQITGIEGRAEVLREGARSLKMPVDKVVPDREDIQQVVIQNRIMEFVHNIAANLGIPVEQLMQFAQAAPEGGGQPGSSPSMNELDAAGNQMGGRDLALFNQ